MSTAVTTRIQLWNKTTSGWESKNPVLLKGEFGFDSDKKYIKIGDGTTAWNDLSAVRLPKECVDGFEDKNTVYDIRIDEAGKKFTLISSDATVAAIDAEKADAVSVYVKSEIDAKIQTINAAVDGKAGKATTLSGYGIADAYTKAETGTQITNAVNALDVAEIAGSQAKTITSISETNGKVAATYSDIQIAETQVTNLEADLGNLLSAETFNALKTNLRNALSAITEDEEADILTINKTLRALKTALS